MRSTEAVASLIHLAVEASADDTSSKTLYGVAGTIIVALIVTLGGILQSRGKTPTASRSAKKAAQHYEALKLWIILNSDADPRKIKDGYETSDEVRRNGP